MRCVKDNITINNLLTEYYVSESIKRNFTEGLDNPNSYILFDEREVSIPVSKAYSVYNQVLTNKEWIPSGQQSSNVYWSTNNNLVKSVSLEGANENAIIKVKLNDNQYGNAVISFHVGNKTTSEDPVYWTWHLWVPKDNPEINTNEYLTDTSNTSSSFKVFNSISGLPPLKTEFMQMVLGSVKKYNTPEEYLANEGYGFQYQWGRKDPIPSMFDGGLDTTYPIYIGKNNGSQIIYEKINDNAGYLAKGYQINNKQSQLSKAEDVLKFSIQNPLAILINNQTVGSDWLSNNILFKPDRWGHAGQKSIYDPCPSGWRIPDFSFNTMLGSPFANANLISIISENSFDKWAVSTNYQDYNITYNGRNAANGSLARTRAYFYKNTSYNLGLNIPSQGFRGININGSIGIFDNGLSATAWSATMTNRAEGYTYFLETNIFTKYHNPSNFGKINNAQNIICSRDLPRFTKEYFDNLTVQNTGAKTLSYIDVEDGQKSEFNFYPNPVLNIIKVNSNTTIKAKIYNIDGMLLLENKFVNKELDVSILKPGVYILIVNDNEKGFRFIKK